MAATADAYVPPGVDAGTWMRPTSGASCGCRVQDRRADAAIPLLALAGLFGLASRRRARRR
jgi:MYXO-CTERM domain-containing protein